MELDLKYHGIYFQCRVLHIQAICVLDLEYKNILSFTYIFMTPLVHNNMEIDSDRRKGAMEFMSVIG